MSIQRCWYTFIQTSSGGRLAPANWVYSNFFPVCLDTGNEVCCIYAICDDGTNPPYLNNPKPFSNQMRSYINAAIASNSYFPNGVGQQPYVYVKVV